MSLSAKYFTRRRQAINHLKNGNFMDVPKPYTLVHNWGSSGGGGTSRVYRTVYEYDVVTPPTTHLFHASIATRQRVPGVWVSAEASEENFLAFWDIWGAAGLVSLNEGRLSLDGGNLVKLTFSESGVINFRQSIEPFDKFRGKKLTLALGGGFEQGTVKVVLKIDTGSEVLESRPFFSRYFAKYTRLLHIFDLPLDMTKCDVYLTFEGKAGEIVSFSGVTLAIGEYRADLPYADNIPNSVTPSGKIILWTGDACPAGYRKIEDEAFMYAYFGDPNAARGYLLNQEEEDKTLGENRHDHIASREDEKQPAAFEVTEDAFISPPVPSTALADGSVNPLEITPSYTGPTDKTLPREHTHLISVLKETVIPPHVKLRMCEKI